MAEDRIVRHRTSTPQLGPTRVSFNPAMNAFVGAFIGSVQLGDVFPDERVEGSSQTVNALSAAHAKA